MIRCVVRCTARLVQAGGLLGMGGCLKPPEIPPTVRWAPICAGAANNSEQAAIDDLTALLRDDSLALAGVCGEVA